MRLPAALALLLAGAGASPPTLEPLGVCDLTGGAASCWDLQGAPAPVLTAEILSRARGSDPGLAFLPRRKNRFLIVRDRGSASLTFRDTGNSAFPLPARGDSNLVAIRVAADPTAPVATVRADVGLAVGNPVDLAPREGASADVAGVRVEIGQVTMSKEDPAIWALSEGRWRLNVDRTETEPSGSLSFEAIGHDGEPIAFVDLQGRPLGRKRGEAWMAEDTAAINAGEFRQWRVVPAIAWPLATASPLFSLAVQADRGAVARLRVRRIEVHEEAFGPFPLDPSVP